MFDVYFLYGATRWYLTFTLTLPFLLQIFDFMTELYSVHFFMPRSNWVSVREVLCCNCVWNYIFRKSRNLSPFRRTVKLSPCLWSRVENCIIEGYGNQHYKDQISLSNCISVHEKQIGIWSTEKSHIVLRKNCLILLLPVYWLYLWVCHSRQIVVLQVWCNIATWDSVTLR